MIKERIFPGLSPAIDVSSSAFGFIQLMCFRLGTTRTALGTLTGSKRTGTPADQAALQSVEIASAGQRTKHATEICKFEPEDEDDIVVVLCHVYVTRQSCTYN